MPLSHLEIDSLEHRLGVKLPGLYRKLLVEMGPGSGPKHTCIYHPEEIRRMCEGFFKKNARQLFAPYFPFGCDESKRQIWVIDAEMELAVTIPLENITDDWANLDWKEYDEWIESYLDPLFE